MWNKWHTYALTSIIVLSAVCPRGNPQEVSAQQTEQPYEIARDESEVFKTAIESDGGVVCKAARTIEADSGISNATAGTNSNFKKPDRYHEFSVYDSNRGDPLYAG